MPQIPGLPSPYTDNDILNTFGPFSQPPSPGYEDVIEAYDAAYLASLNPAQKAFFQFYAEYSNPGSPQYNPTTAQALYDDVAASDQPNIDPAAAIWGLTSIGTVQAMRRFAYGYTSGPALANPSGPQPTPSIPPSGPIVYTLVPPAPYPSSAHSASKK
jgi:hypothetical protein